MPHDTTTTTTIWRSCELRSKWYTGVKSTRIVEVTNQSGFKVKTIFFAKRTSISRPSSFIFSRFKRPYGYNKFLKIIGALLWLNEVTSHQRYIALRVNTRWTVARLITQRCQQEFHILEEIQEESWRAAIKRDLTVI